MKDHGLFQAVCRVNRLDDDDKDYGYIIDYMDLFDTLKNAFTDYTSGAFEAFDKKDIEGFLKDRLKTGKEKLDEALESIRALCEAVEPPKDTIKHVHYFCGKNTEKPEDLKDTEPQRVLLYKLTISVIRAYSNIADDMTEAGYTKEEALKIKDEIKKYENLRKEIQLASGDYIDLKLYEPAMRHLIDSYIGAEESRLLASFDDFSLIDLLETKGAKALDGLPKNLKEDKEAMAETIENNLRKVIIEERPANPAYYDKMSAVLDELIKLRKASTKKYEEYLKTIIELIRQVKKPNSTNIYPASLNTSAKRNLFDNLGKDEELANKLNEKIINTKKDGWRDTRIKSREVFNAIKEFMDEYQVKEQSPEYIFDLVKNQKDY